MPNAPSIEASSRLERLLEYLASDLRNVRLLADASDAALEAGRHDQAKALLERACEIEPQNGALRFRFSHILIALGNFEGALALLEELRQEAGTPPALLFNLAYAQFYCDRPDEALVTLQLVDERSRLELPHWALLMAKAQYFSGQTSAAMGPLSRHLQQYPELPPEAGICALILYDNERTDAAQDLAKRALSSDVTDVFAHLVLGSLAVAINQPQLAAPHLATVVEARPQWGRAWSVLGYMEMLNLQLDLARANFQKAVELMPNHLGTWHGLAWTEIQRRDYGAARSAILSAMGVDRNFSENHGTLAVIEILNGHPEQAEAEVKRGLRLNPQSPSSHYARSLLLTARGDKAAGDKLTQRIVEGLGLQDGKMVNAMLARLKNSPAAGAMFLPLTSKRKH